MIVGFTGTQEGLSEKQKDFLYNFFDLMKIEEFHHGDCIGADEQAHDLFVANMDKTVTIHPPIISSKRAYCSNKGSSMYNNILVLPEKDYLARNHDIVDASDMLIVCPKTSKEEVRSGTWATWRYAENRIPRLLVV